MVYKTTKKIIILNLILVILQFCSTSVFASSTGVTYNGIDAYLGLKNNIKFADINDHPAKNSIFKLASLSIIRENGNTKYAPNKNITREQVLSTIIRLMGIEKEVQFNAEKVKSLDTGKYSILTMEDKLGQSYVDMAVKNNILEKEHLNSQLKANEVNIKQDLEKALAQYNTEDNNLTHSQLKNIETSLKSKIESNYYIKRDATREEILVWLAKAFNLEPVYGSAQQRIYNLRDWKEIKLENLPYIEAILKAKGIERYIYNSLEPKKYYTKAQFAVILDTLFMNSYNSLGYTIGEGVVSKITEIIRTEEDQLNKSIVFIEKNTIELLNRDAIVNLISESSERANYNKGFIIYKNGVITNQKTIRYGDYARYYIDKEGKILFLEVINQ